MLHPIHHWLSLLIILICPTFHNADTIIYTHTQNTAIVADTDDYFDYERPLDFVDAAERRKLMKEAQGDEEKANQMLIERQNAAAGVTAEPPAPTDQVVDAEVVSPPGDDNDNDDDNDEDEDEEGNEPQEEVKDEADDEPEASEPKAEMKVKQEFKRPEPKKPEPKKATPPVDDEDMDALGLDDF